MVKYSISQHVWRSIYPLLIFFCIVFSVSSLSGYIVYAVAESRHGLWTDAAAEAADGFIMRYGLWFLVLANIINCVFFMIIWRKTKKDLPKYENTKLTVTVTALTILLCAGLHYTVISIIDLTGFMYLFPSFIETAEEIAAVFANAGLLVRIIVAVIAAPVVEEILCRGIVLNRLLLWMPKWVAMLVSSVLFGVIHLNIPQGLPAFVIGIVFSMLYLRYRNLWVPIIAHAAYNFANFAFYLVIGEEINTWLLLAPSILVAGVCVLLLIKITPAAALVQERAQEPIAEAPQ